MTPAHPTPTSSLYHGLPWEPMRAGGWSGISDTTGGRYAIEPLDENLWRTRFGFPERAGRPHVEIGKYTDHETARLAAERHDYSYWKSTIIRSGETPVFLGSNETWVQTLGTAAEELSQILVDHIDTADGQSFADTASFFQAQKSAFKQERNGQFSLTLQIKAGDVPRWLLECAGGSTLLLGAQMLDTDEEIDWQERGQQALKRAFMLPADNMFQAWMMARYDRWKLIATAVSSGNSNDVETATEETLRRLLGIPTRKSLMKDRDAISKLEQFDREFYLDLSKGYGIES